jgi:transcriptional regulator with XRE-family HTH domain
MLKHLAAAARAAREQAGVRQIDIATVAGVGHASISRFERGIAWPDNLDAILAAYAEETGRDERELWAAALERWS